MTRKAKLYSLITISSQSHLFVTITTCQKLLTDYKAARTSCHTLCKPVTEMQGNGSFQAV